MLPGVGGPAKRCWCAGHALLGALLRGEFTDPPVAWENGNEGGGKETTGMGILCDVIHMGYIYINMGILSDTGIILLIQDERWG